MNDLEAWREALATFYERDEAPMKARLLRNGEPFDNLDRRAIRALQAAAERMPQVLAA